MEKLEKYEGREHAKIKHDILTNYLKRLFWIISKKPTLKVINYADCFSGPWMEADEKLSGTSIALSLEIMNQCIYAWKKTGRDIKFRALYIEKDPKAFKRLELFHSKYKNPYIEMSIRNDDYTNITKEIANWSNNEFTFFFIDPKGWNQISPEDLNILLQLEQSEFLVNFMYEFQNRALTIEKHESDMERLLGVNPSEIDQSNPETRRSSTIKCYMKHLNSIYKGFSLHMPIKRRGQDKLLYYLVYLTKHPLGVDIFAKEGEKIMSDQSRLVQQVALQNQIDNHSTMDMFAEQTNLDDWPDLELNQSTNINKAKTEILSLLRNKDSVLFNYETWANFLISTGLYRSDIQQAMKQLLNDGLVINTSASIADVSRRRTELIKPNWNEKAERWKIKN